MGTSTLALDKLEQMIGSNAWSAGDRLPPERELAKNLGVGRNTLREALRVLETRGILTIKTGSGAYLTGPHMVKPASGTQPEIDPLHQFEAIYCLAPPLAAWCALTADKKAVARLEQCISVLGRAFLDNNSQSIAKGYELFIELMAATTGNPCMDLMAKSLLNSGKCPAHNFADLEDAQRDQVFAGLVQLWGFIRSHNPDLAEKAARRQQIIQALFFCGREAVEKSVVLGPGLREMEKGKDLVLDLAPASAL